jgi:hypothetical protein
MHPQIRIELARLKQEELIANAEHARASARPRSNRRGTKEASERFATPMVAQARRATSASALIARALRRLQMTLIP